MGSEAWIAVGRWCDTLDEALAGTRAEVFRTGAYQPVPGRRFATLAELDAFFLGEPEVDDEGYVNMDGADGTASVLDIRALADEPAPGVAAPVPLESLVARFGCATPTPAEVTLEACAPLLEPLDRGAALYIVTYERGAPAGVVFVGWSWD